MSINTYSSKFFLTTMVFCIILFTLVSLAHTLALVVKGDVESINTNDINYQIGNKTREDNASKTAWDLSTPQGAIGSILVGMDLPMPYPFIVTIFNVTMLTVVTFCAIEYIHSWVPF